jgi:transcriptional regulator with XRE-family HTH domain
MEGVHMRWTGEYLKSLSESRKVSISALAGKLNVSRRTVYDWIEGQVPKGNHLLALCREFHVDPESFFQQSAPRVLVPSHRPRRGARVSSARQELAINLASEYEALFEGVRQPVVQPVVRVADATSVTPLASSFRRMAGLADAIEPMDFEHAFALLAALGICVLFRTFPNDLKDYAFYTRIADHRVVFVNLSNNVLDLIFPMLHEAVHAVRDEETPPAEGYDETEEAFCDQVAGAAQYPQKYVEDARTALRGLSVAAKVSLLKSLASMHHHTVYGLVTAIEKAHGKLGLPVRSVHGADGNLRKSHPTLGNVMLEGADTPSDYLDRLQTLSPTLCNVLRENTEAVSARRLAELLELPSILDAQELRDALGRHEGNEACISCATPAAS